MNITHLLEIVQTTVQDKKFHGKLRQSQYSYGNENPKEIGRGAYSTATIGTDPHEVRKYHSSPTAAELDPFSLWVKFIIDNNHTDNPHFPKFYNVKKITDKTGEHIYSFTMERLQPMRGKGANLDVVKAIAERDFINPKRLLSKWVDERDSDNTITREMASNMGEAFKDFVLLGISDNIKSESIIEALKIIKQFYDNNKENIDRLYPDIHGGNIMYRPSPHGFTLVFTDPFSAILP